jgi:hypothetical protein
MDRPESMLPASPQSLAEVWVEVQAVQVSTKWEGWLVALQSH